jgi:hypothetical protein
MAKIIREKDDTAIDIVKAVVRSARKDKSWLGDPPKTVRYRILIADADQLVKRAKRFLRAERKRKQRELRLDELTNMRGKAETRLE